MLGAGCWGLQALARDSGSASGPCERPLKRVFLLERPFPRISENTVADAKSKRFIFRYTGAWGGRVSQRTCAPSGCGKGFL